MTHCRPTNPPDTLFIAVNYHSEECTDALLRSLERQLASGWQCTVVNNGGLGVSRRDALSRAVTLIDAGENLGYFGGARLGISDWLATHPTLPRWTIVCNVDLVFDALFVSRLNEMQADVVAPAVLATNGTDQNPFMKSRPSFRRTILRLLILGTPGVDLIAQMLRRMRTTSRRHGMTSAAQQIYAPYGAAIAFNRNYFEKGGTLEHKPLLFGEEIAIGEQARALGLMICYEPSIICHHREHTSTGAGERSAWIRQVQRNSVRHMSRRLIFKPAPEYPDRGC